MKPTFFDWGLTAERPFVVRFHITNHKYMSNMDFDFHKSMHLNIILKGDQGVDVGTDAFWLKKGECLLTAPWEPHRGGRSKTGSAVCMVAISLDELLKLLFAGGEKLTAFLMLPPSTRIDFMRRKGLMRHSRICGERLWSLKDENFLRSWQAIFNFFVELLSAIDEKELPRQPQNDYIKLRPALQMINAGSGRLITAAEAAKACSISISYFRILFRQVFRRPFASYELQYRLNGAANDILKSRLTVKDAAYEWGFFDTSHFTRTFKKVYGIPPGQYKAGETADKKEM
ncbi:MAG: DNA-binding transcriptional regulator AraC [Lentisphaerae bacterium ADurb.Bin242]|nr:MAG: DNA-binding transcriptional regulator AraC [Lentisphaerae bacterium ADurb.Bin242]